MSNTEQGNRKCPADCVCKTGKVEVTSFPLGGRRMTVMASSPAELQKFMASPAMIAYLGMANVKPEEDKGKSPKDAKK